MASRNGLTALLLFLTLLTAGCDSNDSARTIFAFRVDNPSFELGQSDPSSWRHTTYHGARWDGPDDAPALDAYVFDRTTDHATDGRFAVSVSAEPSRGDISEPDQFAVWYTFVQVSDRMMPQIEGRNIVLRGKLKLEGVDGPGRGFHARINTYSGSVNRLYEYGENHIPLGLAYTINALVNENFWGTRNWTDFEIHLFPAPAGVQSIKIELGLAGTNSGTIYFDEIELILEEPKR